MTENKRFALGLSLGVIVICSLWLLLLAGQLGRPHANNLWVEQAYEKKIRAARRRSGAPRVLIVAGSGAMFGVDSRVLADAWAMPVINLSVNAGIGPHFIIDYAQPLVGDGDIVLMPLEYPLYSYRGETNHVFLSFLLSHPHIALKLPVRILANVVWTAPLKRVLEGYLGMPEGFQVAGLYGPHNLDVNGDQINSELALRDHSLHRGAVAKKAEQYGMSYRADALGWQLWRAFADTLQARGACVIFVPPPMMFKPDYVEREEERTFYRDLPAYARQNGLDYRGDPREFLYPPEWFFDTNYHLVAEKRGVYTRALLALLGDSRVERCPPGR
jgi:hypothetical protein